MWLPLDSKVQEQEVPQHEMLSAVGLAEPGPEHKGCFSCWLGFLAQKLQNYRRGRTRPGDLAGIYFKSGFPVKPKK